MREKALEAVSRGRVKGDRVDLGREADDCRVEIVQAVKMIVIECAKILVDLAKRAGVALTTDIVDDVVAPVHAALLDGELRHLEPKPLEEALRPNVIPRERTQPVAI